MNLKDELRIAAERNQRVALSLLNGEKITGLAELSNDSDLVKVRTNEGPVWVPHTDVKSVSRVIDMKL